MSTSQSTLVFAESVARTALRRLQWLREPLVHFVALGGVLFGIDHLLVSRAEDPRTIIVSADVDNEAKQLFTASRGHEPNAEEMQALRRVWLDNEVLYRYGIELQMDKGDNAIRERVIFKALSVVDANVKLPAVDDGVLREWFAKHRDQYDEPARFDFEEAVLVGDKSAADVREFVTALNAGVRGDAEAGLRVFKGRPHANLVQSYGSEFAETLETLAVGKWNPLRTRDGWRAIRLNALMPAKPAVFESSRSVVLQDWKDAVASEQRTAAVRALAKKYTVKIETDPR